MSDEYLSRLRHECLTEMEDCDDFTYQQMEHMIEIIDALREHQK